MYRAGIRLPLSFQHYLRGDYGPESQPHSHPYECEWILEAERLDPEGFVVNLDHMKEAARRVFEPLAPLLLNDLTDFQDRQTSVENVSAWLARRLWEELGKLCPKRDHVVALEVRIFEDPATWAGVRLNRSELE